MPRMKDNRFRPYEPGQSLLLPPNLNDWLPEGHPASFVRDVVAGLDLCVIYDAYAPGSKGGRPPCDPRMMTGLLLNAYCVGKPSSRKIETATYESVPFRVLATDQQTRLRTSGNGTSTRFRGCSFRCSEYARGRGP